MDLRFWILDCSGLVLFFEIYAESGLGYDEVPETRKGYTGYEKDEESGLDFAQARYYNPKHGRYTSVDPLTASANVKNPQTFNRYSYVLNSPYKFVDPLGLISETTGAYGSAGQCDASYSSCYDSSNSGGFADPTEEPAAESQTPSAGEPLVSDEDTGDEPQAEPPAPPPPPTTPTEDFVVSNVDELERQTEQGKVAYLDSNGVAQCARLPIAWEIDQSETPILGSVWARVVSDEDRQRRLSENWISGSPANYGAGIAKGTVLATFKQGKYSQTDSGQGGENHAVIFLNWETRNGVKGMRVIEQRSDKNGKAKINFIPFDNSQPYHSNAFRFSTVRIKMKEGLL
ncbi:MAG: RHS repeat-associated core domain-containing protein [Acidobacteria bacterium]|nr:RHS repeat-associated core domain-containing protein [Acidobacteriota bacterium]